LVGVEKPKNAGFVECPADVKPENWASERVLM
jgi:hypothetical protein